MKVLVTGGAGFIGSHLTERLINESHEVVVFDSLDNSRKENINPKAVFINGDIRNQDEVLKAAKDCKAVFHLAAITSVLGNDPDKMFDVNFIGSKNVFYAARENNAKIIFASSAAVYGDTKTPTPETANCKPISDYGRTKLKSEKILSKDNALILRMFNVYGPRGKGVINIFCNKIPRYEDITINGTGMQTRDYVYVSDVVEAFMLGLKNLSGIYNIGTGIETKLLDIITIIEMLTKAKPHIKFKKPNDTEIRRSCADISKIQQQGWSPLVGIEEGISRILSSKN